MSTICTLTIIQANSTKSNLVKYSLPCMVKPSNSCDDWEMTKNQLKTERETTQKWLKTELRVWLKTMKTKNEKLVENYLKTGWKMIESDWNSIQNCQRNAKTDKKLAESWNETIHIRIDSKMAQKWISKTLPKRRKTVKIFRYKTQHSIYRGRYNHSPTFFKCAT